MKFPHILVVDDVAAIVKLTSLSLRKQGYRVTTAENGLEAVNRFKATHSKMNTDNGLNGHYNVILMDFQMPVMDGLEAMQEIRRFEDQQEISTSNRVIIIGFSAKSDEDDIEVAYKQGMDFFLSKPFNIKAFRDILREVAKTKL
jgi:CheY-like chemotaxis protein